MLDRLAILKQAQLRVRNSVVGALIYPGLLMSVSVAVFALLLLFVVPRFAGLFETLDVPLPSSTKAFLAVGIGLRRYWWALAILLVGAIASVRAYLRTPDGHRLRDAAVLRLPYVGAIARSLITARIVRLLGVLTQGHVPVLDALGLVKQATTNVHYAELVAKAEAHVVDGEPLSLAFSDSHLIAPTVYEAIHSGEQSGQLDRLLLDIADFLDSENEVVVRSLTSIIEPVILIAMGIIVGLVAMSMFMPLFDLTSMVGAGGG
jgi:type II secretory pathway component PulF